MKSSLPILSLAIVLGAIPTLGSAADLAFPVIKPLPPGYDLKDPVSDIAGMRLGDTPEQIEAAIKTLSPDANFERRDERYDYRGGQSYNGLNQIESKLIDSDGSTEKIDVLFTTNISETRAMEIRRHIKFPAGRQPELDSVKMAIEKKFGNRTQSKPFYRRFFYEDQYIWVNGMRSISTSRCGIEDNYYDLQRLNCSIMLEIGINANGDHRITDMQFALRDIRRHFDNMVATKQFLKEEDEKRVNALPKVPGPRL